MSRPISAMIIWAAVTPIPVISSRRATASSGDGIVAARRRGPVVRGGLGCRDVAEQLASIRSVRRSILALRASISSSSSEMSSAWWSSKRPLSASFEGGPLGPHLAAGELGQHLGVTLAGDQGVEHGPAGLAEDVGGDEGELDQGVLEQLLEPLLVPGAVLDEVDPKAGVVAQAADLGRRDEARPQHPPLVELRQPNRVELVGLGAPGHLLDVAGVHQPDDEAPGLEQVDEGPPVVRRRLDDHRSMRSRASSSASSMTAPVVVLRSQTLVSRRPGVVGCGTRCTPSPTPWRRRWRRPAPPPRPWSSTSISSGSRMASAPPRLESTGTGTPGGLGQGTEILIRVLEATVREPSGRAPAPD